MNGASADINEGCVIRGVVGGGECLAEVQSVVGVTAAAVDVVLHGAATHVEGLHASHEDFACGALGTGEQLTSYQTSVHVDNDTALGGALVAAAIHVGGDGAAFDVHLGDHGIGCCAASGEAHGAVLTAAVHVGDGAAVDGDVGAAADIGVSTVGQAYALACAVHVFQAAAVDDDVGVVGHRTVFAAAIHVVVEGGVFGVDRGYQGVRHRGEVDVIVCGITLSGTEHLAAVNDTCIHVAQDGRAAHGDA